jgi:hypothetical protein
MTSKKTMKTLNIEKTSITPSVNLDGGTGVFKISGVAAPEDAASFFDPILNWLDEYVSHPKDETVLTLNFDYFNISASKRILFLLYKLNDLFNTGKKVKIQWVYNEEDEDMYELGQDYEYMVKTPFEYLSLKTQEV